MDTKIYVADTTPLYNTEYYETILHKLPDWRIQKISRYKQTSDRVASAGAFLLLSHALNSYELDATNIEFTYGEHNKPYLAGYDNIFFNLSHSDRRVMCIIGDSENGCDVQLIGQCHDNIARRFFHPEEAACLEAIQDKVARTITFHKIWCMKESIIKALGTGLSTELKSFCVNPDTLQITVTESSFPANTPYDFMNYSLQLYNIDNDYIYAATARVLPDTVIHIRL